MSNTTTISLKTGLEPATLISLSLKNITRYHKMCCKPQSKIELKDHLERITCNLHCKDFILPPSSHLIEILVIITQTFPSRQKCNRNYQGGAFQVPSHRCCRKVSQINSVQTVQTSAAAAATTTATTTTTSVQRLPHMFELDSWLMVCDG